MLTSQARPFAVGLNCALGAADMKPYIANLSKCADCYVFAYPNAGLPNAMGGYDQKGGEMAAGGHVVSYLTCSRLYIAVPFLFPSKLGPQACKVHELSVYL